MQENRKSNLFPHWPREVSSANSPITSGSSSLEKLGGTMISGIFFPASNSINLSSISSSSSSSIREAVGKKWLLDHIQNFSVLAGEILTSTLHCGCCLLSCENERVVRVAVFLALPHFSATDQDCKSPVKSTKDVENHNYLYTQLLYTLSLSVRCIFGSTKYSASREKHCVWMIIKPAIKKLKQLRC